MARGPDDRGLEVFLADAAQRIQAYGEGFPRLELWGRSGQAPELALSLRTLPELGAELEMRTAPGITLDTPTRKGPNIARFAALNRELGAEALLTDESGYATEGATTSLVWWGPTDQDGHIVARPSSLDEVSHTALTAILSEQPQPRSASFSVFSAQPFPADPEGNRVSSVTEGLLFEAANKRLVGEKPHRQRSGQLSESRILPVDLTNYEVWAVNALHGIRVVTAIDCVPTQRPERVRLNWFREALDRSWDSIS